jgi:hypothetical protein
MLNLLGDVCRRSQNVTDKEFIAKLVQRGIEYTVKRIEARTYIEVGASARGSTSKANQEAAGLTMWRLTGLRIGKNGRRC